MSDLTPEASADDSDNARPYSVSELAFALKSTLEDRYGFVRLRGELSKVTFHSNGHVYLSLKDERAVIDGVVWKGSVRNLSVRPEQGLEVVVTGRITTYPQGSRYQIVIESMTAAGVGALLAQLTGGGDAKTFQPMNCKFGLFPPLDPGTDKRLKGQDRKKAYAHRARADLDAWLANGASEAAE